PNVVVTDLDIYYNVTPANSRLRAGTYGRGLWQSDLFSEGPPVADFTANTTTPNTGETVTFSDLSNNTPTSWSWAFDPATITFVGGTTSSSQNPQVQFNTKGPYTVTLLAANIHGSDSEIKTNFIYAGIPGLWTGVSSSDWTVSGNWDNLSVPTVTVSATIPESAANWPIFTGDFTAGSTCADLNIEGTAEMTITGDFTIGSGNELNFTGNGLLKIGGDWTNTGTFEPGAGTVEFNGAAASIINIPPGNPVYLINDDLSTWTGNWNGNLGTGQGSFNQVSSAYAGGTSPEARFYWITGNLTKRMYYDPVNTTGHTSLTLDFRHMIDHYDAGYTVKVEYSTNGTSWYDAGWSVTPAGDVAATQVSLTLTDAQGVGSATYYVSFTITGNLYNVDYWYIDDVQLHYPGISNEIFYNLTIANSSATTSTNGDIMIENDVVVKPGSWFTNSSGNTVAVTGDLIIEASAGSMGSFIDEGSATVSGASIVEQYITSERWHLVSAPVSGATINTYFDIYLKEYNESTNNWTSLVEPTTIAMITGQGYAAWADDIYTGSAIVEFIGGELNHEDCTINPLDYTPSSPKAGFNLIGNPYPSAIDWNADWSTSNLSGWAEIYDNGVYRGWHPTLGGYNGKTDGIIPSTQGFWVRALNGSASITIPLAERIHDSQTFYKNAPENDFPVIRLEVNTGDFTDETVILFHPEGTQEFDGYYDLEKLYNSVELPQLYSLDNEFLYAYNVMSANYDEKTIPVGFENLNPGVYHIRVSALKNFTAGYYIYLEDILQQQWTELEEGLVIAFSHSPINQPHRFNIRITKSGLGANESADSGIQIYSFEDFIFINVPAEIDDADITVYDVMGRVVVSQSIQDEQEAAIRINNKGSYIVKVINKNLRVTQQVCIR
ncbi:MAG: T9SS type A sorting domain-containing protein, partial [Bacteroidetes bacterium]|nr:T9SS type A sorting domain-containing protein [Bacteroidota bacterium]